MKINSTPILVILFFLAAISSCTSVGVLGNFDLSARMADSDNVGSAQLGSAQDKTIKAGSSDQLQADNMVLFEGTVFVASTEPKSNRWEIAGWRIAKNSNSLDDNQVPQDCTLYPHKGVENQWIGSCSGPIYIPSDGATHIAVMHTQLDGSSILVQVAPAGD